MFFVFGNMEVTADFDKNSFSLMMGLRPGCTYELMEKQGVNVSEEIQHMVSFLWRGVEDRNITKDFNF